MLHRSRWIAAPLLLAPLLLAAPAHAADRSARVAAADEKVVRDDVVLSVRADGVVHGRETLTYDFATGGTGFTRTLLTRIRDDDTRDRVFKISGVKVSAPYRVKTSQEDGQTRVEVTGPRKAGQQTITLDYNVRGAVTALPQYQEVRWAAVGGWDVPVVEATVTLKGGAPLRNANCFAGSPQTAIGCSAFSIGAGRQKAIYGQQNMLSDEYLTVVAGLPAGTTKGVASYADRRTLASAFSVNAVTGGVLALLLLLTLGGLALLYLLRGRDGKADASARSPLGESGFEPPDGVRPGQVGTLIDESADVIDVTASILDLAVRGYLLVEEVEGRSDWTLRRLDRPVNDLLPYEQLLYDGLFVGGPEVKVSQLGGTFSAKLAQVRRALYADVVEQGWFTRRPDAVRTRWTILGYAVIALGVVGTLALAVLSEYALVGLGVLVFGLALVRFGRHMPAKTAKGSTVLAHTLGFQKYLAKGDAGDVPDRQRIALFSRFLPYAVVFDTVGQWTKTVADAGVEGGDNLYWYEGAAEGDLAKFAESMRVFTLVLSGAISQSRPFTGR